MSSCRLIATLFAIMTKAIPCFRMACKLVVGQEPEALETVLHVRALVRYVWLLCHKKRIRQTMRGSLTVERPRVCAHDLTDSTTMFPRHKYRPFLLRTKLFLWVVNCTFGCSFVHFSTHKGPQVETQGRVLTSEITKVAGPGFEPGPPRYYTGRYPREYSFLLTPSCDLISVRVFFPRSGTRCPGSGRWPSGSRLPPLRCSRSPGRRPRPPSPCRCP